MTGASFVFLATGPMAHSSIVDGISQDLAVKEQRGAFLLYLTQFGTL